MSHPPRRHVLHEASLRHLLDDRPNTAVLPWAATEGHGYHLPHGTDVIEATALGEASVRKANEQGGKCLLLPTVPFGNDNMQLSQVATITMRSSTQQAVLHDVAESLVRQGFDRMVVLNFHGGNEFKQMIRDIMLDLPIFIMQIMGSRAADWSEHVKVCDGDHANEFETSLVLHLEPEWVDMSVAADGAYAKNTYESFGTQGVWFPRDWAALTESTGTGDPRHASAADGEKIFAMLVDAVAPILRDLSRASPGEFPFIVPKAR